MALIKMYTREAIAAALVKLTQGQEPVAYIRRDQLQKAARAARLCEVGPESRDDKVGIYTIPSQQEERVRELSAEASATTKAKFRGEEWWDGYQAACIDASGKPVYFLGRHSGFLRKISANSVGEYSITMFAHVSEADHTKFAHTKPNFSVQAADLTAAIDTARNKEQGK